MGLGGHVLTPPHRSILSIPSEIVPVIRRSVHNQVESLKVLSVIKRVELPIEPAPADKLYSMLTCSFTSFAICSPSCFSAIRSLEGFFLTYSQSRMHHYHKQNILTWRKYVDYCKDHSALHAYNKWQTGTPHS